MRVLFVDGLEEEGRPLIRTTIRRDHRFPQVTSEIVVKIALDCDSALIALFGQIHLFSQNQSRPALGLARALDYS
jgi:hypothetical protein